MITYDQYEKISDDILFFGNNAVLKFNTSLAKVSENYGRQIFHREVEYNSKNSIKPLISLKRTFDFYMSIENYKALDNGTREFIRIGVEEIILLRQVLARVCAQFSDNSSLYVKKSGRLVLANKMEPFILSDLPMGKYLKFEIIVYSYQDVDKPGVRIYLSDENNFADVSLTKFMGLVYLINSMNMYQSAQEMLNYVGRPEYGTNMYSMNNDITSYKTSTGVETVEGKEGRFVQPKTNNSNFFNKVEGMLV